MQFGNFHVRERTPRDVYTDKVYAAMETGNPAAAREALKEFEGQDSEGSDIIRRQVQKDYGIRL